MHSALQNLTDNVAAVAAAGGTIPAEYTRTLERWQLHHDLADSQTITADYIDMVLGDTSPADLARQRALVLASHTTPVAAADLDNELRASIYQAAREAYDTVADTNYRQLQDTFNTTAAALVKAIDTIDPDTPADTAVTLSDRQRRAWTDAALHAASLDNQLHALWAAAKLAGITVAAMPEADQRLSLTIDVTSQHHRRKVWEALDTTTGRTGRWGALTALGVIIAAADLDHYQPYRRPAPTEERWESTGRGTSQRIVFDPEDQHVTA